MAICPYCRNRPVASHRRAVTCGHDECKAANKRWHKLKWWHKNRGSRQNEPIVNLEGALPEMDYSNRGVNLNIPEVDNTNMPDTRTGNRVNM